MSGQVAAAETLVSNEQTFGATEERSKLPEPTATGNDRVAVLTHKLLGIGMGRDEEFPTARIELAIRNVSKSTIATVIFEARFYDQDGNTVDTVRHTEVELNPETSRLVRITSSIPVYDYDRIQSYEVRLVRTTTAETEKVQFRSYEMTTLETGEEQVTGIVKNVGEVKIDAAVVATFYDAQKETIGMRVLLVREIEPNTVKRFDLRFKPQEGDTVRNCSLAVAEVMG